MDFRSKITPEYLLLLLSKSETLNLEFKQEWYKLDDNNQNIARAAKHELIRDILGLVNGNSLTAGEEAYLIVGASDLIGENGKRELLDIEPANVNEKQILAMVNAACEPAIPVLNVCSIELEGKRLIVIIIPPSVHLHETTIDLFTKEKRKGNFVTYHKYTAFVRHGDNVEIASAKERASIQELKRNRIQTINPLFFGAGVGSIIGGLLVGKMGEKISGSREGLIGGVIAGTIAGGVMGGSMGSSYKNFQNIRANWYKTPSIVKIKAIIVGTSTMIASWIIYNSLNKKN